MERTRASLIGQRLEQERLKRGWTEESTMMIDESALSRRDALRRLASLPIEICGLSLLIPVLKRPIEEILMQCAAGITACWSLRKGQDLAFASDVVSRYIPTLKEIAATGSATQRKDAAGLLAQCFLLKSGLALSVGTTTGAIRFAEQAELYSSLLKGHLLQVAALRAKSTALSYATQPERAFQAELEAAHLIEEGQNKSPLPSLLASYVYGGLAISQGYYGQKEEAERSLGKAHTFFEQSADEEAPPWFDHSIGNVLRCEGEMYMNLGIQQAAINAFEQIETRHAQDSTITLTCRAETLAQQVVAEVNRADKPRRMEWSIEKWKKAVEQAMLLKSEVVFNDSAQAYRALCGAWPGEKAIRDLREYLVHW